MKTRKQLKRGRGFTLIELMVVVVIIAILAAIAYPSYARYSFRARRADAQTVLMHVANAQERYYSTYNKYTQDSDKLGFTDPIMSENNHYQVTLAISDQDQKYTATATPQGVQASDACGALSIDNAGDKQPDVSDSSANSNGSCW